MYKNGNLISEPNHVAKLFNAYFTEIAERLQSSFTPGVLNDVDNSCSYIPSVIEELMSMIHWWNDSKRRKLKY
jgi:hypothetical protein